MIIRLSVIIISTGLHPFYFKWYMIILINFFLFITLFLYLSNCLSEDYILEFQAKVKNSIEYNISNKKNLKTMI